MATETIVIENFKGIAHLELEVKAFTVLIGPQSVGKSVTAKLLYYFRTVIWEVFSAATEGSESSLDSRLLERFAKFLPPPTHKTGNSSIRYSIGSANFSLTNPGHEDSGWQIELPTLLRDEFLKIKTGFSDLAKQQTDDDLRRTMLVRFEAQERYFKSLQEKLGASSALVPRFIPAGRSFYSQVEKDAVSFFESASLDPFVAGFGRYLAQLKDLQLHSRPKALKSAAIAAQLTERLLSGKYQREGQRDYITVEDGRKLPTALWSSGQQESLPLVFLLQKYSEGRLRNRTGTCLFVEEPEAHLFPASQRTMIELIALAFNSGGGGLNVFITTHSPYVLSTINVLLKAGRLFHQKPTGAKLAGISKVVTEQEALSPGSVGAYYMDRAGCRSIVDEETGLIDGRAIDDVSGELAEQFDALNDLQ